MPNLLVRDVEAETLERLKARARRNGRSLQNEIQRILGEASRQDPERFLAELARLDALFPRAAGSDSVDLLREDRER